MLKEMSGVLKLEHCLSLHLRLEAQKISAPWSGLVSCIDFGVRVNSGAICDKMS